MTIPTQGPISFSDIRTEFGGSGPISIEDYIRGGALVPMTPNAKVNNAVPTTPVNLSILDFRGTAKRASIAYALYAGGGAGGFGFDDGGEQYRGTYGDRGGLSRISGSTISTITAVGGYGGQNCGLPKGSVGGNGQATDLGPGGVGSVPRYGNTKRPGGSAPSTSYGAGGGGAGGDEGSPGVAGFGSDEGGYGGEGGQASVKYTGRISIVYGNAMDITIGAGGSGSNDVYNLSGDLIGSGGTGDDQAGGSGAGGYCSLIYDDVVRILTQSGSLVID